MSVQTVWSECLGFLPQKSVVVQNSAGRLSSDAGLLVVREFDERIGLTRQFAAALIDRRRQPSHSLLAMVRQRVYGILAGYEDQNDHDTLRHDPVFQLICDRLPDDENQLASQPTLSRFENSISVKALFRLRELLVDQFLEAFDEEPRRLTFDLDGFDDPAHGAQQLTLFHGYYKQNQYFPLIITNAETDLTVMVALRHGTAHAALGADEDLEYLVTRLRQKWPDVDIEVRAGQRVRRAADVRGLRTARDLVHVWNRHEFPAESGQRRVAGRGRRALRADRREAAVVHGAVVSGADLGSCPKRDHQGRMSCGGDESAGGRQ